MNKGFLIGNVVKTPELRTTASGKSVTTLRVATDKGANDSIFLDFTFFDKLAETLCQYIEKGRQIHIEYRLDTYKGPKDEFSRIDLVGSDFTFLGKKKETDEKQID